jgi:hypothetical protein
MSQRNSPTDPPLTAYLATDREAQSDRQPVEA